MVSQSAKDYLRLSLVPGVGAFTAQQLIRHFGSAENIWQQSLHALRAIDGVGPKLEQALLQAKAEAAKDDLKNIVHMCEQFGIHIICAEDECWPAGLRACTDAPLVLYVTGQLPVLRSQKMLAVVGARKASSEGKLIARRWSSHCSKQGVCVISGMAPGIDSAAHGGSIDADAEGIAVLGYGLLAGNVQQQQQIDVLMKKGCVVSEYSPKTVARAAHFPQRNRLIAGIAQALLVVEGGLKSGSLITVRQALNYGKDIFAVPGSILNDIHAGCHQLLKDGATLVTDAEDILHAMAWHGEMIVDKKYQSNSDAERQVITFLERGVLHVDTLAEDCSLTMPALSTILLRLELKGVVEKLPGSRYTLS